MSGRAVCMTTQFPRFISKLMLSSKHSNHTYLTQDLLLEYFSACRTFFLSSCRHLLPIFPSLVDFFHCSRFMGFCYILLNNLPYTSSPNSCISFMLTLYLVGTLLLIYVVLSNISQNYFILRYYANDLLKYHLAFTPTTSINLAFSDHSCNTFPNYTYT